MRKKVVIAVAIIQVVLSVMLIPIPRHLKDGGTVEYNALLYSVHKVHSLNMSDGYDVGTKVRVLFWVVFDDVHSM